jgi:hypothetical protein
VAGITVAGTLGATVLTLLWSARREDRRWQRERQDRHEQDRAAEYAKLVAALHAWYTALTSAGAGRLNAGLLDEEPDTSDDRRQRTATREVVAMVDFMAPPNVRELAWRAVRAGEMYYIQVTTPSPVSERFSDLRGAEQPECLLCVAAPNYVFATKRAAGPNPVT